MADICSMYPGELSAFMEEMGEPGYRASQIFGWIHKKGARSWQQMSDLPARLRERLQAEHPIDTISVNRVQVSGEDGTRKYLFELRDGELIESVLMRYSFGNSVCVSSQAGCRMGCAFCASTLKGLARDLTAGEMLAQVYTINGELPEDERVSRIVVMGSGEPMDNYDQVIRFLRLLSDERGYNMSMRGMTVSTCGIVPGIERLAGEKMPINLAISLHAPNDAIRKKLMPIANEYPIDELIGVCRRYYDATGRRLTWEYALVRDVNDSLSCADELAERIRGINSVVNLIAVNPVAERGLCPPDKKRVEVFRKRLEARGVDATVRRSLGRDIDGACGQLRNRASDLQY